MTRYGMVVDVTTCIGCYNCFITCKDEHCGTDRLPYAAAQPMTGHAWMRVVETERGRFPKVKVDYTAIPCMHCEKPPCVEAGRDGAVYQRKDGIVIVDPAKAAGQKDVVKSCPYRVIYWNEEAKLPQKCTLCAHLLDAGWKEPRCVEACPTGALVFGDLDDPGSDVSKLLASGKTEVLRPEYELGEKVRYVGLPKSFVAGAVVFGDIDECAEAITVVLEGVGAAAGAGAATGAGAGAAAGARRTAVTDKFGDFEFEGLPANTTYRLTISAPGYAAQQLEVKTSVSVYLGDIVLGKTA
jgi:Fe-S-cluster-containing dehydrogenase component